MLVAAFCVRVQTNKEAMLGIMNAPPITHAQFSVPDLGFPVAEEDAEEDGSTLVAG